jgi:tetratricopeptide (TPR) repeat protein
MKDFQKTKSDFIQEVPNLRKTSRVKLSLAKAKCEMAAFCFDAIHGTQLEAVTKRKNAEIRGCCVSMSKEEEACCANCGIAEIEDINKLEEDLFAELDKIIMMRSNAAEVDKKTEETETEVHNVCANCGRDEEFSCKMRAAILHDNKLFTQPDESHLGECPICFLPMQLDPSKSLFYSCCSKVICNGCDYANDMSNGGDRCPFCREPTPDAEEFDKNQMERVKAGDPAALRQMGTKRYDEEGDYDGAVEYFTKAAELGDAHAHYLLGRSYREGEGVEKDEEKEVYHLEKAAIGGHPKARHNLGCIEENRGRVKRAMKHYIIAAKLGQEDSMKYLWECYKDGDITKENLEVTLRIHKAAIDEMKSPERERAEKQKSS